jgi:hexosaminidase
MGINLSTFFSFILFSVLLLPGCTENKDSTAIEVIDKDSLPLIPYPQKIKTESGAFELSNDTYLFFTDDLASEGQYLLELVNNQLIHPIAANMNTKIEPTSKISLSLSDSIFTDHQEEGYLLDIQKQEVSLKAQTPTGIMRGIQTLRQLFVTDFHQEKRSKWYLPLVLVEDYPAFQHRGLLLDVCRHYFDKKIVLKYIDALAYYKMNVLHFHLTEDQGWRMPIDKYPLLNEISSWRLDTNGQKYGGYFTKEELKEIVAYAEERHITVIPEIELPGHAQAALAAYPQFSCNGGPIEVVNEWGVFKEIYCAGNDSTFIFLEDVLTEVMDIFPSKYIHIGGDEAPKFRWEHCPKCQQRMQTEGLKDEFELQSYFVQRIEQFLNKNGRQLIGWDEILEGGLSPNATVQSWRGMDGGKEAAESNHQVIMSPTSHCYLDYPLSSIDLQKIYEFDPIPADLDAIYHKNIIGGECNMWTERVPDEANLDSKVFPRMMGLAEVLWTYPQERKFDDLYARVKNHHPALKAMGIAYGFETTGASVKVIADDSVQIELTTPLPDLNINYRWLGDSNEYRTYKKPFTLNRSDTLIVQAYRNGKAYGDSVVQDFVFHEGLLADVQYETELNAWYPGSGPYHLVDGQKGSANFRDGNWQGFSGDDLVVEMDLKEVKNFLGISFQFYHYPNAWIYLPIEFEIETSTDGQNWESYRMTNKLITLNPDTKIGSVTMHNDKKQGFFAQYLKIKIKNQGKVPKGHDAEGEDAWLFIDEIVLR